VWCYLLLPPLALIEVCVPGLRHVHDSDVRMLDLLVVVAGVLPAGVEEGLGLVDLDVPGGVPAGVRLEGVRGLSFEQHCPLAFKVGVVFVGGTRWCFLHAPSAAWEPPAGLGGIPRLYSSGNQGFLYRLWDGDVTELHPELIDSDTQTAWLPGITVPKLEQVLESALHVLTDLGNPEAHPITPSDDTARSIAVHVAAALHVLSRRIFEGEVRVSSRLLLQDYDGTKVLRPPRETDLNRPFMGFRRSQSRPVPSLLARGKKWNRVAANGVHRWSEGFTYRKVLSEQDPLVWEEPRYWDVVARFQAEVARAGVPVKPYVRAMLNHLVHEVPGNQAQWVLATARKHALAMLVPPASDDLGFMAAMVASCTPE
jgi:hypothetical protein